MKIQKAAFLAALLVIIVLIGSCSLFGPDPSKWTFIGTWQNPAYNGMGGGPPAKIIVDSNSGIAFYDNVSDAIAVGTGTYSITDDWVEQKEIHWFKGIWNFGGSVVYFLAKVYSDGDKMESNGSDTTYPTTVTPSGQYYGVFYRQGST